MLTLRVPVGADVAGCVIFEVRRLIVGVIEVISLPVIVEPEPVCARWNETVAGLIMMPEFIGPEMPLADVSCSISAARERSPQGFMLGAEAKFVDHHPGAGLARSGQQRGAIRRAHRGIRDRLMKVAALRCQPVDIRRPGVFVAGITARVVSKLVREHIDKVRPFGRRRGTQARGTGRK